MNVSVEQGSIAVNDVSVIRQDRGLLVLEVDCHSKYPEILGYYCAEHPSGTEVLIYPGEHTLWKRDTEQPTVIRLPEHVKGWDIQATAARYTVRIVCWKPGKAHQIWRSKEEWRTTHHSDKRDDYTVVDEASYE